MYHCKRCNKDTVEYSEDEGFYVCDPCGLCYDESELIEKDTFLNPYIAKKESK